MSVGKIQVSGKKRYSCGMGLWEREKRNQIDSRETHSYSYHFIPRFSKWECQFSRHCMVFLFHYHFATWPSAFKVGPKKTCNLWDHQHPSTQLQMDYWLVVSTPLKNINQLGWLFPIYGKITNVPNHQPDYIAWSALWPPRSVHRKPSIWYTTLKSWNWNKTPHKTLKGTTTSETSRNPERHPSKAHDM